MLSLAAAVAASGAATPVALFEVATLRCAGSVVRSASIRSTPTCMSYSLAVAEVGPGAGGATVEAVEPAAEDSTLAVSSPPAASDSRALTESVAAAGACLLASAVTGLCTFSAVVAGAGADGSSGSRRRLAGLARQRLHEYERKAGHRGGGGQRLPPSEPIARSRTRSNERVVAGALLDRLARGSEDRCIELRRGLFVGGLLPGAIQRAVSARCTRILTVVVAHCRSSNAARRRRYA
jgi:hypothetical protein